MVSFRKWDKKESKMGTRNTGNKVFCKVHVLNKHYIYQASSKNILHHTLSLVLLISAMVSCNFMTFSKCDSWKQKEITLNLYIEEMDEYAWIYVFRSSFRLQESWSQECHYTFYIFQCLLKGSS